MSQSSRQASERGPDEVFCRNCGAVISAQAELCPECGVRQRPPPQSSLESTLDEALAGRNPFVAALLSALFPGLGQIYNRELEKGLLFIVASFVALASALVLIGFVLYPAVWLYSIYDAYKVAERRSAPAERGPTEIAVGEETADATGGVADVGPTDAEDVGPMSVRVEEDEVTSDVGSESDAEETTSDLDAESDADEVAGEADSDVEAGEDVEADSDDATESRE